LSEEVYFRRKKSMESCAYCGEDIEGEGVEVDGQIFCSEECLDAYNEERLDFLDPDDFD
jgi:predicted nucleic acid-binding Zn ribbon protein